MSDYTANTWRSAQDSVIGAMLFDPECVPEVLANTDAGDFEGFDQAAYSVIRRLNAEGKPVDRLTLLDGMGPEYAERILAVMETTVTAANVSEHVRIVREQSRLAALRRIAAELASATDMDGARELVARAEALTVERRGAKARTWAQMIDTFMFSRRDNRELEFLDWGFPALNATLHVGAGSGKYILLGGEPSSGKSALMFQLALSMSRSKRVAVFSYETDEDEMTERMASSAAQVSFRKIIRNRLELTEWRQLNKAFSGTYGNTLETVEASGMSAGDVAALTRARRYQVIFIDYVQLVAPESLRDNREQQVAKISRTLQGLAKQGGIAVVGLSQLSRPKTDQKGNVLEPSLHDFRESGQLEQDADAAMILYKPWPKAEPDTPAAALRRLSIVKNKKDSLAKINLRFDGEHQTFSYIHPEQARRIAELEEPDEDNPWGQEAMAL